MPIFAQEDIAELDVAVNDALGMNIVKGLAKVVKPVKHIIFFKIAKFSLMPFGANIVDIR